jgi:hypothetical protein
LISLFRRVSNWTTRQGERFGMRLWNVQRELALEI